MAYVCCSRPHNQVARAETPKIRQMCLGQKSGMSWFCWQQEARMSESCRVLEPCSGFLSSCLSLKKAINWAQLPVWSDTSLVFLGINHLDYSSACHLSAIASPHKLSNSSLKLNLHSIWLSFFECMRQRSQSPWVALVAIDCSATEAFKLPLPGTRNSLPHSNSTGFFLSLNHHKAQSFPLDH